MTIATAQEVRRRPMATQRRQQPDQHHGIFCSRRACARAPARREQRGGGPCKNEAWELAVALIGMVIEGKLLLPRGGSIGVVQSEYHGGGGLRVTGAEVVHEGLGEPIEVF